MDICILWHHDVFNETAIGIDDALFLSGTSSTLKRFTGEITFPIREQNSTIYIILGFHRFAGNLPKYFIAFQSEQVGSKWFTKSYFNRLSKSLIVWDFSPKNINFIRASVHDISAKYIPIRVPMISFTRQSTCNKDIDVLFYGAMHQRRKNIENQLKKAKYNTVFRYYDLFENDRDALIDRSKIVLNLHYWEHSSLETHRIEYLCSRSKCVISERSSDFGLDEEYKNSVVFCDIESIVKTVGVLLKNEEFRIRMEKSAFDQSYRRQIDIDPIVSSIYKVNNLRFDK